LTGAGEKRLAAVSIVADEDGDLLVVWNKRYGGWTLPGGMVEENETPEQGQIRELLEETGLPTERARLVFVGDLEPGIAHAGRAAAVHVYLVDTPIDPHLAREKEAGCPVTFFSRSEFLYWCPFRGFYARVFDALTERALW